MKGISVHLLQVTVIHGERLCDVRMGDFARHH